MKLPPVRSEPPPVDRAAILAYMKEKAARPLEPAEMMAALGLPGDKNNEFAEVLKDMENEGLLVRTRYSRYGVPERMNLVVGTFEGNERGFGFIVPLSPGQEDMFIAPGATAGAMHRDRVVARRTGRSRGNRRPEGEVIRVLARANHRLVGTLQRSGRTGLVIPDQRRIPQGIQVSGRDLGDARDGEKVIVEITAWPGPHSGLRGRVVDRLGRLGDPGVDILSVMHNYGLKPSFPPDVEGEAEKVPDTVVPGDLGARWDLRDRLVFTIDGENARDLDDAVSLERLPAGDGPATWRLGVHVADVSHYVRQGTALDREAGERATSVYLVDRVVPMLPHRLSNGICSLNPGVDRLTVSVFMDMDGRGRVVAHRIGPSVIRSRARLTYNAAWRVIGEEGAGGIDPAAPAVTVAATPEEARLLVSTLLDMRELAAALRDRRFRRGSIDFDLPEPEVFLSERGRPLEVRREERNLAHRLIEEFMLAANEMVAEHCVRLEAPFIFRVHEEPDREKVEALGDFLHNLGIPFRPDRDLRPRAFQKILESASGRTEEALVSAVVLRAMQRARYSPENLGHFGLAAPFYCHFTSPIRRYPDLVVHRILKEVVSGGAIHPKRAERLAAELPDIAGHSSGRERLAAEAEMETVKIKMAEYMAERVGEVFPGLISGVTSFGFFVQLENLIEGLVHVSSLTDDYYQFDEKGYALIGERTSRRFRLGDRVTVKVAGASAASREVDFRLNDAGPDDGLTVRSGGDVKRPGGDVKKSGGAVKRPGSSRRRRRKEGKISGGNV